MKFTASSTALSSHLQAIGRVINSKNSMPILDCFLLEIQNNQLKATASDSETTLTCTIDLIEHDTDCRFAINAKTILDALKEIPEQPISFTINVETMEVFVEYQNGHYNLITQHADEYPTSAELSELKTTLAIQASSLLDGINRTLFASADDELRPVMNGIYFDITTDYTTFVASDGHKLVRNKMLTIKGDENSSFILPKKPANILKNLLGKEQGEVTVTFDTRNAMIVMENHTMVCRLIEGRYPNYNSVIPQDNPNKAVIERSSLLSGLKRVLIFSSQSTALVKLKFENNLLIISGQDIDFSTSAEEKIACSYTDAPISIGFKGTFLIDILNNINSQEIIMELADPSRAGVVVPETQHEDEELLMLLMPMMLND